MASCGVFGTVAGMAKRGQRWRQVLVWLHVLTSVCWLGQALALVSLLALGVTDPSGAVAATTMARHLDMVLLAPLANASAFTGFLLAATTSWGFVRYWWVAGKFAITLTQLYLGIFVLSSALAQAVAAARSGTPGPAGDILIGGVLMAGAIGFQAWLSISKPWGRISSTATPPKLPTAPSWLFAAAGCAVCVDLAMAQLVGFPLPAASPIVLIVALVVRRRAVRAQPADLTPPVDQPHRVRVRRTALLVVAVLALQPLLWNGILHWIGDGGVNGAGPAFTVLHHLGGWLGAITIGAALVIAASTWLARNGRWQAKAMGTLTFAVCAVFAVTGILMMAVEPVRPVPLGLLLISAVLLAPLAGIAAAGRRCLAQ